MNARPSRFEAKMIRRELRIDLAVGRQQEPQVVTAGTPLDLQVVTVGARDEELENFVLPEFRGAPGWVRRERVAVIGSVARHPEPLRYAPEANPRAFIGARWVPLPRLRDSDLDDSLGQNHALSLGRVAR